MDKQKQIEEMAVVLTDGGCKTCADCSHNNKFQCKPIYEAELLYNAGYRKQSEGEWIEDGYEELPCVCSRCGTEAPYVSTFEETFDYDWEENAVPAGYVETREYIRTPFCPNCGAKMKGGESDA